MQIANSIHSNRLAGFQRLVTIATAVVVLVLAWPCLGQRSPATLPDVRFTRPGLVLATAVQDDGKIIIGGYFSLVDGVLRNNIARLNADGSLDETWNPSANGALRQIIVSGSNIFALGDFTNIGGEKRDRLARLSVAGSGAADPGWNPSHPGN